MLRAVGADLVPFDPTADEALPDDVGAMILAGGFPENAATATPWLDVGEQVRGHEFHYSTTDTDGAPAWQLSARGTTRAEGIVSGSVQASYLHVHWAAHPEIPSRFVRAAAA